MPDLPVPLLDIAAQTAPLRGAIDAALARVLDAGAFIGGPEVAALEAEIAANCGTSHAVGCASGTDAILLVLMALGVGPGDEVICPSYTFFATAGSIARLGAVPVFADIDPATCNVTPQTVRAAAVRCTRLRAIMPVHLYGQVADMDGFLALGRALGVPVVEDAAQAIGAVDRHGLAAGSRGGAGCFSFYPTKNLGACGDAGIVTTNDAAVAERVRLLGNHGMKPRYHHSMIGANSRLDAMQAAILRVKLPHLPAWSQARRANAEAYDRRFRAAGALDSAASLEAGGLPLRTPQWPAEPARHIFNQYVIRVPGPLRDALREDMRQRRIGTEIYYPIPLHLQPCFAHLGYRPGDLPASEEAAAQTLALPISHELTRAQIDHVAASVLGFLERQPRIEAAPVPEVTTVRAGTAPAARRRG
jgi:dTDP-4-amino-4,6-dideoxygalactose transaminase